MKTREKILERLHSATGWINSADLPRLDDKMIFRDYPVKQDELWQAFSQSLEDLHGETHQVGSAAEAAEVLKKLLKQNPEGSALAQESELIESVLNADSSLSSRVKRLDNQTGMPSTEMASFDVGITAADCLVARTGSVVLRCTSTGGRRLSVLPAHHIVLARKEQLVASLEDALPSIQKDPDWSFATLITGPSRTADIEKILVLGAHGPKRLTVILIG